jgi:hypothetical protein
VKRILLLGVLLACGHANAVHCDWTNPGSAPYRGDPAVAIGRLTEIPPAQRAMLAYRALKLSSYDDVIYVTATTVTSPLGRAEYAPEIARMNFSDGRICDTITRPWKPEHVETAIVFCEQNYCVARFEICRNWAIVRRVEQTKAPASAVREPGLFVADMRADAFGVPVQSATTADAPVMSATASGVDERGAQGSWAPQSAGYAAWYAIPAYAAYSEPLPQGSVDAPAAPVPEPGTWAILIAGLIAVAARKVST